MFTFLHFAVYVTHHTRPSTVTLFEHLEDAMKEAQVMLHNSKSVEVYSLENHVFGGKKLFHTYENKTLVDTTKWRETGKIVKVRRKK